MSFRILHPLYEAASLIWTDEGIGNQLHLQGGETREQWLRSPLHLLHSSQLPFLRRRLVGRNAQLDFPLLEDLKETGGTDYLCLGVPFQSDWNEGVLSSWLTDRPRGFTDGHLRDIRSVMQPLAYALKSRIERQIAENIASAYLGRTAGERVLSGAIRRGDGERISGALWYSDLRGSTALAERLTPEDFLAALNAYFEVALHYGSFIYGNIGTADRLQFTAIGSSINELARIQDLTKSLGEPLLASGPFTEKAGGDWRGLGEHKVRGLDQALPLFAL
ncbi:MAG: hypothetical protein P8X75_13865 [Limibacillus sp.]